MPGSIKTLFLAFFGLAAGGVIAAGVFAFLAVIGVFPRLIGKTGTKKHVRLYESFIVAGGILGNLIYVFRIGIPAGDWGLGIFGVFAGIFVGCWSMALAEILNVFPVFMRRARIVRYMSAFVISLAVGKGMGACLFFFQGW